MGNKQSIFSEEEMDVLMEATFFSSDEILRVYGIFIRLARGPDKPSTRDEMYLTQDEFKAIPELSANPFRDRIAAVFSEENEDHRLRFDDFLDFLSVFSQNATREVKAYYAFKLYDFNSDGYICADDITETLHCIIGTELTEAEKATVCAKILQEADMDGDDRLSFVEFEHLVSRSPDFVNTFRIRV